MFSRQMHQDVTRLVSVLDFSSAGNAHCCVVKYPGYTGMLACTVLQTLSPPSLAERSQDFRSTSRGVYDAFVSLCPQYVLVRVVARTGLCP
ncbi:hypothetical protein BaRGS_00023834 [Batillaria attramentaria]|uniref:Uncharacterized protein n=1 Tax=Batillaria attramentaria TaxID=370345 RepID=A0ABD0KCQ6_9CAEN